MKVKQAFFLTVLGMATVIGSGQPAFAGGTRIISDIQNQVDNTHGGDGNTPECNEQGYRDCVSAVTEGCQAWGVTDPTELWGCLVNGDNLCAKQFGDCGITSTDDDDSFDPDPPPLNPRTPR